MPIYEYQCADCGEVEEALQAISDKPLTTCKRCSGKLHKIISQSTFHLKGSGWYVTDYTRRKGKASESSGKKGETDAASKKSVQASTGANKTAKSAKSESP